MSESEKLPKLIGILRSKPSGTRIIIFCTTKRTCDILANQLRGFNASAIHGDKRQQVPIHSIRLRRLQTLYLCFATCMACRH